MIMHKKRRAGSLGKEHMTSLMTQLLTKPITVTNHGAIEAIKLCFLVD